MQWEYFISYYEINNTNFDSPDNTLIEWHIKLFCSMQCINIIFKSLLSAPGQARPLPIRGDEEEEAEMGKRVFGWIKLKIDPPSPSSPATKTLPSFIFQSHSINQYFRIIRLVVIVYCNQLLSPLKMDKKISLRYFRELEIYLVKHH